MKRVLLKLLAAYLSLGFLLALMTLPPQMYVCPAPEAPHGEVTYGGKLDGPPRDDCRPWVTTSDRLHWVAVATPLWLPGIVLKGLSNMAETRQLEDLEGGLAPL